MASPRRARLGLLRRVRSLAIAAAGGLVAALVSPPAGAGPLSGPVLDDGTTAELVDVLQLPATAGSGGRARINFLREAPDGSGRLFVNDLRGRLYALDAGTLHTYLDVAATFPAFRDAPGLGTGFTSFAFHPGFATNGLFYTVHSEDVGGTPPTHGPAIPDAIAQHAVLTEWHATNPAANAFAGTRRELLRVAAVHVIHNLCELAFDPAAAPGSADYGLLYVAGGDNGAREIGSLGQVQRLDTLYGAVLRIDPLGGTGAPYSYGIPATNPFANDGDPGTLGEIFAYGFRNAHRLAWDRAVPGRLFALDVGEHQLEEVNRLVAGRNYGWDAREGTYVYDASSGGVAPLPANDAALGFTYPVAQYDHDEGIAIAGGVVDRSRAASATYGKLVYGDIASGRLFYSDVLELLAADDGDPATTAAVHELHVTQGGLPTTLLDVVRAKKGTPGLARVDLRFGEDLAGNLYVMTKQDGMLRRLVPEARVPALPAWAFGALALGLAAAAGTVGRRSA
ncbi:MAG: PQQ-dependent sugar dehydrogenase [Myxococcota bacterium]